MKTNCIVYIILIIFMFNNVDAMEIKEEYHEIIESTVTFSKKEEKSNISRKDCITFIMKLTGVDDSSAEQAGKYTLYDPELFNDVSGFENNDGYIFIANINGIAKGIPCSSSGYNFEPYRAITVKECLAFMMRCIKEQKAEEWSNVLKSASEWGLVKCGEIDESNENMLLTHEYFYILLYRMLNQNVFYYWGDDPMLSDNVEDAKCMRINELKEIKYIDLIKSQ